MYINDAEECERGLMEWMGTFTVRIGKWTVSNLQYLHYKIVLLHYRRYFVAQNDNLVMRSDLDLLTMLSQVHLVALRHSLQSGHLHLRRMPEADLTKEPWRFCGERNLLLVESTLHFLHVTATSITHCRCVRTLHLLLRAWTAHLIAHLVVHQPWTHFYFRVTVQLQTQ